MAYMVPTCDCVTQAFCTKTGRFRLIPVTDPRAQKRPTFLQHRQKAGRGLRLTDGPTVFGHACKMGLEGIVSKRLGSRYVSGRTRDWLKFKNPEPPAVKREAEEDWS
jgi:hypothetical protein